MPEPVDAVTTKVVLDPGVTPEIAGVPPRPLLVSAKSPAVTPVTLSLKVTVHVTVFALEAAAPARTIDATYGGGSTAAVTDHSRVRRYARTRSAR